MASAQGTNVSPKSYDGPIIQPSEDLTIAQFVHETATILSENGRVQDFPYMANRSADLLHGNIILKQILSEITSKCDEKTAYEEMQKYMYRLVLEELLQKCSIRNLAKLALARLQSPLPATMQEYLVLYSEAIKHELQRKKIANELKTKLDEYTRWETDGEAYLRSSDNKKGIQCCEKALAISTELGYQFGIIKGYQNLASVYLSMAQYEKAIVYSNECLAGSVKIGNPSGIAGSNQNLGYAYFKLRKYEESIDYFKKSSDMFTNMESQEGIASNNQYLGRAYCMLGQNEKCIDYYKKSLDMYTKLEKWEKIASISESLGSLYCVILGQYKKCINYFENSLDMYTKLEKWAEIANSNESLGNAYFNLKKYENAIDYYKKSLDMYTKLGMWEKVANSNENLGNAYFNLKKYENAIDYYKKSLDMYTKLGMWEKVANSNESLGNAYFNLKKYENGIDYSKKSLDMYTKLGMWEKVANSNKNLGDAYCMLDQYENGIDYLKMHTKMENQEGIASSNENLGLAYFRLEKYEESIDYSKKSLDMHTKMENQEGIANSNENLSLAYFKLEKYKESIDFAKKSLDEYTKLGNSEKIACTTRRLGDAYLSITRYEEASRYFKDSLAMYTEIEDQVGIADTNGGLGRLYVDTNQPEKAMECFKKFIAITTEMGNQSAIAWGHGNVGLAYRNAHKFEKAITHSEIALKISSSLSDKPRKATYFRILGKSYDDLEQYEKAIFFYKKALEISTGIGSRSEMANSNSLLGCAYHASGKFEKALEHFEKVLVIGTDKGNQHEIATTFSNMASIYSLTGQLEKAIDYRKRSLAICAEMGDHSKDIANSNLLMANIYIELEKYEEAIPYFEKAAEIYSQIRNRMGESTCFARLGSCYYFIYLVQALQLRPELAPLKLSTSYFRKSIECCDSIFLNLIVDENQTSFTNRYVMMYVVLTRCFIFLKRFETALLVADLCKAKALQISIEKRSTVSDYARKTWQAIDDEKEKDHISDIAKAIQLEKNCATVLYYSFDCRGILNIWVLNGNHGNVNISIPINTLSSKEYIYTSVSKLLNTFNLTIDGRSSFFHTTIDVLEDDVEKLLLQESNPNNRVFQNQTSPCSELTKQDLEKVAQGDDLVVEIEKKMSASNITENLNDDKANMNKGGTDNSKHLRNLFMALIHPIQEFIKGTKLIIIPDDFLFFVPFSALLDENGVYLSEKYSIQITPSLHTLYSRMLVSEPVSLGPALFVGNPTVGRVTFEGEILHIASLSGASEEVTLLAWHFDTRPLTGCEAIKSRVLNRISDSSIIHIAAHGDNLRGEIYLSPNPEWKEQGFDLPNKKFYLLQERDIISMDIKARLVVLCCCTTGRGKISSEGVIGLARSFLAAGAQCVLATLWRIHDEGTKLFMEKFYDELLKEVSVCEALKTAMNVFQRHETGFYRSFSIWAPFTIFGKDVRFSRDDIEEIKWQSHEIYL